VYGWSRGPRKGFVGRLLEAATAGESLPLRDDVVINPIDLSDLCRAIDKVLSYKDGGVFHLGGREEISTYEFGRKVCEEFGLSPETVRPVRQGDPDAGPDEAGNYVLRSDRALRVLSWQAHSIRDGLRRAKEAWERSEKGS
jgi:dTDP-4-dehydrorhamnose reductase